MRIPSPCGASSGEAETILSWNFKRFRPAMFVAPAAYQEVQFQPKPTYPLPFALNSRPMVPFAPTLGVGSRVAEQGCVSQDPPRFWLWLHFATIPKQPPHNTERE